ncbi:MAG: 3-hydroxyanthranilate 3,4-dioxygenase [Phycisphaerales bacterium]|nr:3-hydroxyanthranilate 3,4-dioxygenase [Phycisphaerales bacterium]
MSPLPTDTVANPIDLMAWCRANKDEFKPPVSNKYLYDGEDFFAMVIGGPNARNDFHVTNSEELFYQLQGDIVVVIREGDRLRPVPVREGETFFVPGGVPHAPTRPPGTLGLVIERRRPAGEIEHQQFYCDNCEALVHDQAFDCADIVEHFAQAMEAFWADPEKSTCPECGHRCGKPAPVARIEFEPEIRVIREGEA